MNNTLDESQYVVRRQEPFNAEPLPDRLVARYLTPQSLLYVRCHGTIPDLGADHAIAFGGEALDAVSLTLGELKARFDERRVVSTMQCAGNRRADLQPVRETSGDPWDVGAIGNVEWTGASLADILAALGIGDRRNGHIACTSADSVEVAGETAPFGISIPLARAMEGDVLVAWGIGDEPLNRMHGGPMRLVVPGYAGVRSAKWLTKIEWRADPSDAPIQAKDYKLFPPSEDGEDPDWSQGLTIDAMPVNSAICSVRSGDVVPTGASEITGYALAYGRAVARVELSVDAGRTWREATFLDPEASPESWRRWKCAVDLAPGLQQLVVRAWDSAGQSQPEHAETIWNYAGYLSTAWHSVSIEAR